MKQRGFGAMQDKKMLSELAAKGGRAAHASGTAHEWSPEQAREAGRKGGKAYARKREAHRLGTCGGSPGCAWCHRKRVTL